MNQISCSITSTFLHYTKNIKPELLKPLLEGLPYDEKYLLDPNNWITWEIERILEERLVQLFNDKSIMFKIGRSIIRHRSAGTTNIVLNLFLTPERLIGYTPKIARYFTKDIVDIKILETSGESATVELKIKGKQTRGACLFNQGLFSVIKEVFSLDFFEISETQCVVPEYELGEEYGHAEKPDDIHFGAESCIFRLRWRNKKNRFLSRFAGKEEALKDALLHLEDSHAELQRAFDRTWKSEAKYRDLMENASDIICFLDMEWKITALNRKGIDLSGYKPDEIAGQNFLSFIDEAYKDKSLSMLNESLNGIAAPFEVAFKKKGDEKLILSINPNPVKEGGVITGLMLIARDITKEREVANRLLEAERFASKGMIAAEIAHEINNSLANIETALYIINKVRVERQYREDLLKDVYEEIERMSGIVKGVLEVYRSDDSVIQQVDINAEILKVVNITRRRLKGKGISVSSTLASGIPPVSCYPGHIKQILLNVIKNAEEAMYSTEKRLIVINTGEEGDFVEIVVTDSGCGIPEEKMKNIFTPMYTSKSGGAGLGLPISREIARRYGGDLKIESEEGKGTVVTISLPKNRYG